MVIELHELKKEKKEKKKMFNLGFHEIFDVQFK